MSKGVILTVAAVCGLAAFVWTLAAHPPRRDRPVAFRQPAPSRGGPPGAMAAPLPTTLDGLERYVKDNPTNFQAWFDLARRRRAANLPEESAAWAMVVQTAADEISRQPDWGLAWYQTGWASERLGDPERARAAFTKAEAIYTHRVATVSPIDAGVLTRLGWARLKLGNTAGAHAAWQQGETMLKEFADPNAQTAYNLACFRALLGKPAEALDSLATAVEKGYIDADWAAIDEDLLPIAHDPRFAALLQKMKDASGAPIPDGEPAPSHAR